MAGVFLIKGLSITPFQIGSIFTQLNIIKTSPSTTNIHHLYHPLQPHCYNKHYNPSIKKIGNHEQKSCKEGYDSINYSLLTSTAAETYLWWIQLAIPLFYCNTWSCVVPLVMNYREVLICIPGNLSKQKLGIQSSCILFRTEFFRN